MPKIGGSQSLYASLDMGAHSIRVYQGSVYLGTKQGVIEVQPDGRQLRRHGKAEWVEMMACTGESVVYVTRTTRGRSRTMHLLSDGVEHQSRVPRPISSVAFGNVPYAADARGVLYEVDPETARLKRVTKLPVVPTLLAAHASGLFVANSTRAFALEFQRMKKVPIFEANKPGMVAHADGEQLFWYDPVARAIKRTSLKR